MSQDARMMIMAAAVAVAITTASGCASRDQQDSAAPSEKSWTMEAQARRAQRLRDSILDARSPQVIADAWSRRLVIDVAQEASGIIEARSGSGYRRAGEKERRELAIALSHQRHRGMPAIVAFIDSATGRMLAAYNERGEAQ